MPVFLSPPPLFTLLTLLFYLYPRLSFFFFFSAPPSVPAPRRRRAPHPRRWVWESLLKVMGENLKTLGPGYTNGWSRVEVSPAAEIKGAG